MNASRFALLPLLLLLAGCASPEQRIQQNQDLFDSFPVATQARIRGGQIDLGFTPDMVRIALGEPQRTLVRRYERQRADIDGLSVSGPGAPRSIGGTAWINTTQEREYLRLRVEFQGGVAAAIEEFVPAEKQP